MAPLLGIQDAYTLTSKLHLQSSTKLVIYQNTPQNTNIDFQTQLLITNVHPYESTATRAPIGSLMVTYAPYCCVEVPRGLGGERHGL